VFKSKNLCVLPAVVSVKALAHNSSIFRGDDAANAGIGRNQSDTLPGQAEGAAQERFVVIVAAVGSHPDSLLQRITDGSCRSE
jgi:hypothetical protein